MGSRVHMEYYIRITLTSHDVLAIEKVSTDLIKVAKDKQIVIRGPIRIPTKIMNITTRQSPCGNGTKTFEYFNMRIFKRVLDISSQCLEIARHVTATPLESGVEVEVTIA